MATKPIITIDGNFSDWVASEEIDYGDQPGYSLYSETQNDGYLYFDLNAPAGVAIGANTTIWLNTDLNNATGYNIFGFGAEYDVEINADGTASLYQDSAGQTAPTLILSSIPVAYSATQNQVELAIPLASIGNPSNPIDVAYNVNNTTFGPVAYTNQPYVAPNADVTRTPTHKVAIVYSDTTAALYFRSLGDAAGAPSTAYDDLFMAAQNQARMAGVSYDIIDKSQLTNVNNLIGYDAIIFPAMTDVNTAQLPAIMSALTTAVYDYHIPIITSGDFLTNDQNGNPLPGNPYVNMETLLGVDRVSGGNSGNVTVTANDLTNPAMKSYTAGQVITTYTGTGYTDYAPVGNTPADVLVNQNVTDPSLAGGAETIPGVTETTVGGATSVEFASQDLLGDSNLLSNVIQSVVLGTQPGVTLNISRDAGVVAVRMDMDQSQFPDDVTPTVNGVQQPASDGIYGTLIPILQQWNQQYNFVGSFYINIGDDPTGTGTGANGSEVSNTNWAASLPYYQDILAMGSEIGNHSYTHLINPPTETFTATTVGDTPTGSTQITLTTAPPSFGGNTVGMFLTDGSNPSAIGFNTTINTGLTDEGGTGDAVANTLVTAVNGDTISISYTPAGYGGANVGTLADIPAGTTLTFAIPPENTNFLQTTGTVLSADGNPFTYAYEFGTAKTIEEQELGTTVYGAAVPGAAETATTSQNIQAYYQSVAPTATTPGYVGYLTGGWTGISSGDPSAIGYMDPTDEGSLYIAPNMTFDFTEVQYEGKTPAQAEADWDSEFASLTANAAGTPIVVLPIHDYGVAAWNTDTDTGTGSPYSTAMYTDFIQQAYNDNYEFLTLEELASRIEAEQKASINYTTVGNTITATVTPDPTAPDLGAMALDVVNDGTQVIQNAGSWYAYDSKSVFVPYGGGTFSVTLGTTQDDVTHIDALPMRADLQSVTGDGSNLTFSFTGDGTVDVHIKTPGANLVSVLASAVGTGAGPVSATLLGDDLKLVFDDGPLAISSTSQGVPVQHTVTITESPTAVSGAIVFGPTNDILFQNNNGQAATWQVNGATIGSSSIVGPNPGPSWSLEGTGTFFAGDTADYLWRGQDGSVAIWQMSGSTVGSQSAVIAANPGTSWLIAGTGDFYGDGHTDILWQNDNGAVALWEMNGTTIAQSGVVAANPGPTWHIKGTGDFYGDGHTDILWQNDNGAVALWEMNGTTITQSGVVAANPGPTWHIEGTGDFYGDGHTDILWQNDNGSVALWEMNGTTITRSGVVAANPGPTWHIAGTGDFNGDGKSDIAWRNDDGSVAVWDMNGTTIQASAVLANPGTSWNVSGFDSMKFIYPTPTNAPLAGTPAVADEFVLTSLSSVSQTITGFDPMQDIVELSKAQFTSFTQVQAATSAISGGAMINLGNGGSLVLPGVNPASLHAANFAYA